MLLRATSDKSRSFRCHQRFGYSLPNDVGKHGTHWYSSFPLVCRGGVKRILSARIEAIAEMRQIRKARSGERVRDDDRTARLELCDGSLIELLGARTVQANSLPFLCYLTQASSISTLRNVSEGGDGLRVLWGIAGKSIENDGGVADRPCVWPDNVTGASCKRRDTGIGYKTKRRFHAD